MNPITQIPYATLLFMNFDQRTSPPVFRADDVVLMTTARDEQNWLTIAQSCVQSGTRLLVAPAAEPVAGSRHAPEGDADRYFSSS